jgi:hypothetical protein
MKKIFNAPLFWVAIIFAALIGFYHLLGKIINNMELAGNITAGIAGGIILGWVTFAIIYNKKYNH